MGFDLAAGRMRLLPVYKSRKAARSCPQESLRERSEGPEGRSVTWPLASAFTQLAAETHPSVSHRRLSRLSIRADFGGQLGGGDGSD